MLVLSQGTGVLPMLAVQSGAGTVTAIERGRMLYRMAKQTLAANPSLADSISLLDRPLSHCAVSGESCYTHLMSVRDELAMIWQ